MSRTMVVRAGGPVTPPREGLTDSELLRLLRAFTRGKTEILEDDALVLVQWANRVKWEGVLLQMVLQGKLVPSVADGQVYLGLPARAQN